MKPYTMGALFGFAVAGSMMASACGSEGPTSQDVLPETATPEPAQAEPQAGAESNYEPSADDGLKESDRSLGVRATQGEDGVWVVDGVVPGSPAALAGIQDGDRVLSIDHLRLDGLAEEREREFRDEVSKGTVEISVERAGQPLTLMVDSAPSPEVFPLYFPDTHRVDDKALTAGGVGCFTACAAVPGGCIVPTAGIGRTCGCIPCFIF